MYRSFPMVWAAKSSCNQLWLQLLTVFVNQTMRKIVRVVLKIVLYFIKMAKMLALKWMDGYWERLLNKLLFQAPDHSAPSVTVFMCISKRIQQIAGHCSRSFNAAFPQKARRFWALGPGSRSMVIGCCFKPGFSPTDPQIPPASVCLNELLVSCARLATHPGYFSLVEVALSSSLISEARWGSEMWEVWLL